MVLFLQERALLVDELLAPLSVLFVMKMMKILCMHCLCVPMHLKCDVTPIYGMLSLQEINRIPTKLSEEEVIPRKNNVFPRNIFLVIPVSGISV
jgi:hypothetical protein